MNKLLTVAAAAALTSFAGAQLIYVNGTPDLENGNEMTHWLQAENFTLGSNDIVGNVRFWTIEDPIASFDGNIDWFIFNDSGGVPGSVFASGTGTGINRVATGNQALGFYDEYVYDFAMTPTAVLGGVQYWLGLHLNTGYETRHDIYWETTNNGNAPTGQESENGTMDNWFGNAEEHAFELYGVVPEPGTFVAIGIGLAGLAFARRRR